MLLLVLSSGTAASVYVAGDAPRRVASMAPSPPFELDAYRTRDQIRAAIDSLVAPLGTPVLLDDVSYRRIVALAVGQGRVPATVSRSKAKTSDTVDLELFGLRDCCRLSGLERHALQQSRAANAKAASYQQVDGHRLVEIMTRCGNVLTGAYHGGLYVAPHERGICGGGIQREEYAQRLCVAIRNVMNR